MTTEKFEYIVKNQNLWSQMFRIQEENKKQEYQRKCREYQEIKRRERGVAIRFPEKRA